MNIHIGRCEIIALSFFVLITTLETLAIFFCFADNHRHFINLTRVITYTTMFNIAIMWFTLKYKTIRDKIHSTEA